jgi:hypothetical protein
MKKKSIKQLMIDYLVDDCIEEHYNMTDCKTDYVNAIDDYQVDCYNDLIKLSFDELLEVYYNSIVDYL